jgi:hypothetical protein
MAPMTSRASVLARWGDDLRPAVTVSKRMGRQRFACWQRSERSSFVRGCACRPNDLRRGCQLGTTATSRRISPQLHQRLHPQRARTSAQVSLVHVCGAHGRGRTCCRNCVYHMASRLTIRRTNRGRRLSRRHTTRRPSVPADQAGNRRACDILRVRRANATANCSSSA